MKKESGGLLSYNTLVHALAGATGSVVAMSAFYPLDTVRSRLQLEEDREAKNTLTMMKELVKEEGFPTLYRGIVPVLESLCASNFVYFYTFHGLKTMQGVNRKNHSAVRDLFLASVAGVVNVLTTTPLWVVNTRLKMRGVQMKHHPSGNRLPDTSFNGLFDGLFKIAALEGVQKLWSGTLPSLLLVSNPAIQFMVYEAIKRRLINAYGADQLNSGVYFLVGATAKAIATLITYPVQIVQTKLRHGHNYPGLKEDAGLIDITKFILRKDGIKGLFKGLEAKILQTVLTAALMFMAYEKIAAFVFKLLLRQQHLATKAR